MNEMDQLRYLEQGLNEPVSDAKLELARQLFVSLENQVQVADRKVQAVFSLNAFLVAALALQSQKPLNELVLNALSVTVAIDLVLKACFLTCVCLATWAAIRALTPRLKKGNSAGERKPSLFFFGDIIQQRMPDFLAAFLNLSNEEGIKELLGSCHSISTILSLKYKMLNRSTLFLTIALLLWILVQVNKFLG